MLEPGAIRTEVWQAHYEQDATVDRVHKLLTELKHIVGADVALAQTLLEVAQKSRKTKEQNDG